MLHTIYNELKQRITVSRLKDVSIHLIARYKERDLGYLSRIAQSIGVKASDAGLNKLFSKLMQIFHPDKHQAIINEIEAHYLNNSIEELTRLRNIYLVDYASIVMETNPYPSRDESYSFSREDFGYGEFNVRDDEFEDLAEREEFPGGEGGVHEYNFTRAVNDLFFGNLDRCLSLSDLNNLYGELDLSDFEINDLSGIEHCANLTGLNLSTNRIAGIGRLSGLRRLEFLYISDNEIEDIGALRDLIRLVELDISFNSISDISVLLELNNLKYVNLINNPVSDKTTIHKLLKKGIIVIY